MCNISEQAFWDFSCAVYQNPQTQTTLLALQDEQQKNINLCLLLLYLEQQQVQLSQQQVESLAHLCHELDKTLLHPQRSVRRALKEHFKTHAHYTNLRQKLLAAELQLERLQQAELIHLVASWPLPHSAQRENLVLYIGQTQTQALKQGLLAAKS